MNLIRKEMIPPPWMMLTFFFKVGTTDAEGEFLKEIHFPIFTAVGPRNQPATCESLPMGRAEHFGTRQNFPTCISFSRVALFRRRNQFVIFEQEIHSMGLLWPGKAFLRLKTRNIHPDNLPHKPVP